MKRVITFVMALCLAVTALAAMAGCSSSEDESTTVTIGTLATEDILPMWVAQEEGIFDEKGAQAEIQVFQSATELIAAVTAGEVDMAMTDPMVTASIYASGTDVQIQWVTLGTAASQGRFGIMTSDKSIKDLKDLAGVEIGVGSNTILEYVMDTLMIEAGIPEDQILTSELQKLPVRFEAMTSGQVKAAALPGSLLALGEAQGCYLVADDTSGDNISQSVMIVNSEFLENHGTDVENVKASWDAAVEKINANPENYRSVLVENANLSEAIADTYPISEYPTAQLPTQEQIDNVLTWMLKKGYLSKEIAYDAQAGTFSGR